MELHKILERVDSKESFLEFLAALRADLTTHGRESTWENPDLDRYLEAMQAWTEARDKKLVSPTWRTFADMLYAAKIYE